MSADAGRTKETHIFVCCSQIMELIDGNGNPRAAADRMEVKSVGGFFFNEWYKWNEANGRNSIIDAINVSVTVIGAILGSVLDNITDLRAGAGKAFEHDADTLIGKIHVFQRDLMCVIGQVNRIAFGQQSPGVRSEFRHNRFLS